MYKVLKRNGDVVDFTLQKIKAAIGKAFASLNRPINSEILETLALKAIANAETKVVADTISVEDIQDSVEKILSESGYFEVAKSYILYRDQHKKIRNTHNTLLDYQKVVDDYLKIDDWRVKESSTITYSLGGLILGNSGAITANYWLSEVYDDEIADAHRNVRMHIHDLSMLSAYCAGWNLKDLIMRGIISVSGRTASKPAAHLSTLANQMVNFLGILQNEWAGAQAFSSFDTYLAPFVKADNLNYEQVKQAVQSFVFGVNTPSRWGCQAPFTNVTLDWTVPDDLKDQPAVVGGKEMPFTYGECQSEMDMVNKAFIEVMLEGDADGRGHQYPIPTYSITPDFDWSDTENNRMLFGMAAKYGIPYFSNYVNSDMKPSDIRSMCPLRGDQRVLVMDDYSGEWHISTIENLHGGNKKQKVYDVLLNGEAHKAVINKFDGLSFLDVETVNGHKTVLSTNHLSRILRKKDDGTFEAIDIPTGQILPGDYLPFTIEATEGHGLAYEDGIMAGAFMGDGSLKDDYSVTFSLNNTTKADLMDWIVETAKKRYGAKISMHNANESGTCVNVTVTSKMLRGLIEDYVHGKGREKTLDVKAINRSLDFRRGIVDGLMVTDGTPAKRRIYSASGKGVESVCAILASMGLPTRVTTDNRSVEDGSLSKNPVHCVQVYDPVNGQPTYGDVYIKQDGYMWFRVKGVTPADDKSTTTGYCFEVLTDEPYFMLPSGIVTHNCRLRLDLNELRKRNGGFFGSGENTGSIGVVTINLPQAAYLSTDEAEFFTRLDDVMDVAARSLDTKRRVLCKLLDAGLYPYTKAYLGHFDNHFSTIGLVGMNEACLNAKWIRKDMTDPEAQRFAIKVLDHMRDRLIVYQNRYGAMFNLEATPAESTCYRFAKHDVEKYPDIITANMGGTPYYTNSTNLPVGYTEDIFSALDVQDELQIKYTSGTVFHAFLGEKLPDWKAAMAIVRKIAENYRLPYYTLSPTYSVCPEHGYLTGEQAVCPHCGSKTEIYSRITGYYRAVQNWNDGKTQEFADRKTYDIGTSVLSHTGPLNALPADVRPDRFSGTDGCDFTPDESTDPCCGPNGCRFDEPDAGGGTMTIETYDRIQLVTTQSCPNCKIIKAYLAEKNIPYDERPAESNIDWIRSLGISQAPTAIMPDGSVVSGQAAIRAYVEGK